VKDEESQLPDRKERSVYPHWISKDVIVDGVKIHYTRTGDGSKPPLVLAHGFSDNGLCWTPLACDLEADYDVILPDARGHGQSARVQPGENIDLVADTAGFIRALGLNQPILGGHSMGANTSAQVGARFPGLIHALVLEDPPWREPEPPKEPEKIEQSRRNPMEWILKLKDRSVDELIAQCRKDNPVWQEAELRPWAESKKQFDYNFIHRLNGNPFQDWQEVSQAIHCPTLLITANPAKGAIVPAGTAIKVAEMNAYFQWVRIPRAGHNIRRENYPRYLKAVRAFLKAQYKEPSRK
jgi:N-formylmaleamate deformylase